MIAALYVQQGGVYYGLPNVDPWGLPERDARAYAGPYPVIAHPPCARWSMYWFGGPSANERRLLGDDDGCFEAAIRAVQTYGGVLEHPANTYAWATFDIPPPNKSGGWSRTPDGGWTCHVEQGHYGHRARKATWLYAGPHNRAPKELRWGPSAAKARMDDGYITAEDRRRATGNTSRKGGAEGSERLSQWERSATPDAFRDVLIKIASAY